MIQAIHHASVLPETIQMRINEPNDEGCCSSIFKTATLAISVFLAIASAVFIPGPGLLLSALFLTVGIWTYRGSFLCFPNPFSFDREGSPHPPHHHIPGNRDRAAPLPYPGGHHHVNRGNPPPAPYNPPGAHHVVGGDNHPQRAPAPYVNPPLHTGGHHHVVGGNPPQRAPAPHGNPQHPVRGHHVVGGGNPPQRAPAPHGNPQHPVRGHHVVGGGNPPQRAPAPHGNPPLHTGGHHHVGRQ